MSGVLVLNASYQPLHNVSLKHAIRMLVREVAVVEEADESKRMGDFPFPRVLRLVRYVAMKWRSAVPRWSRRRLFARDNGTCIFRGKPGKTIDHLLPLSRGGKTTWDNTAVACKACNHRKADRTPEEMGWRLRAEAYVPTWWQLEK